MTDKLQLLEPLYREWNAKINVISRKDMDAFYSHHVQHSLCIAEYLRLAGLEDDFAHGTVLDLGTGGGFPGIPLAVAYPEAQFTLCDSVGKKTLVAGAVAKALDLQNVEVVNARAESLGRTFDYVVSRAVASLTDFYPWVKGRYRKGILYLKGGDVADEVSAFMARYHIPQGAVHIWKISSFPDDPWYEGKLVIHIEK